MISLMVTLFSEKILIFTRCKHGFMSNLIKKSWTDSNENVFLVLICILQNDDHDDMYDDTHKHKRCTYQKPGGTVLKLVEISNSLVFGL